MVGGDGAENVGFSDCYKTLDKRHQIWYFILRFYKIFIKVSLYVRRCFP